MIYPLTLVRHLIMAAWVLALATLGFETLFPGSVSIRVPLYPLMIGLVLLTMLGARLVIPWQSSSWTRWVSALLFVMGVIGVVSVLSLAQWGTTTLIGTALAMGLAGAWLAGWVFVAHDETEIHP